jgi:hypothetical protein
MATSPDNSRPDLIPTLAPPVPSGLANIARPPTTARPLDPNGVDVAGEIPYMQRAYAQTGNGRNMRGTEEAGYSIFEKGNHTPVTLGPESHLSIPTFKNATAIVHTHPATGDPDPSNGDTASAASSLLPNYVYSANSNGQSLQVVNPNGKVFKYAVDNWNLAPPTGLAIQRK